MSTPAIGIDLGTTYSCLGVFQHGKVEIIKTNIPSCVAFTDSGQLVGEVAKSQAERNPENTVFDAKRMIGRKFGDRELQQNLQHWPFKVCDDNGDPKVSVKYKGETKLVSPVEISAMILSKMKKRAEAYLGVGKDVTDAVITVPAYFNNSQRQATKDAGEMAGLNVKHIINEPTAAALAYGLDKKLDREQTVLIVDLGGVTFDVSVLTVADNVVEVLSTARDTHLGGEDFDHRLVKYFSTEFKRKHKKDISSSPLALRRLKTACEEAKRTLSSSSVAYVRIWLLYEYIDFSSKISRARFDELCADQFRCILDTVQLALDDAKLERFSIDEVVLVGGSMLIPKIRKLLQDFFDGKRLNMGINADEAVAYGATVQAAVLSGEPTPGADNHLLLYVVPFSMGFRVGDDDFCKIIERNCRVPVRRRRKIIVDSDYQTAITIKVYRGEHKLASDNNLLGLFELEGLPAARRGEMEIAVTFDVDDDGFMDVSAKEETTGRSEKITIRYLNVTDPDELRRLQTNASNVEAEVEVEEEERKRLKEEVEVYGCGEEEEGEDEGCKKRGEKGLGILRGGSEEGRVKDEGGREKGEKVPGVEGREMEKDKGHADKGEKNLGDEAEVGKDKHFEDKREKDFEVQVEEGKGKGRGNRNRNLGVEAVGREKKRDIVREHEEPKKNKGEERRDMSDKGERSDAGSQGTRPKMPSATRQRHQNEKPNELQQDGSPPVDKMSDNMLLVVQTLLDGEPKTSITERLEIYHRCVGILSQLNTTSDDPHVKSRCSDLHAQLRNKYGDAAGSYNDVTNFPGIKPSSLRDRLLEYINDIRQAVEDAGDNISKANINTNKTVDISKVHNKVSKTDCDKVNSMCKEMLSWVDNNEYAGEYELLRRIKELQSTCEGAAGLQVPSDDVKNRPRKDSGKEGEGCSDKDSWKEGDGCSGKDAGKEDEGCSGKVSGEKSGDTEDYVVTNGEEDERRQSHGDMPPLEEVY